jgi:hypothetical protein
LSVRYTASRKPNSDTESGHNGKDFTIQTLSQALGAKLGNVRRSTTAALAFPALEFRHAGIFFFGAHDESSALHQ